MKTAVSIPDDVFQRAEQLAKRLNLNRSQLVSRALAEFVAKHSPEEVTETLNEVCAQLAADERFSTTAATYTLGRAEW
jgi:predicted transcriptional regulator